MGEIGQQLLDGGAGAVTDHQGTDEVAGATDDRPSPLDLGFTLDVGMRQFFEGGLGAHDEPPKGTRVNLVILS